MKHGENGVLLAKNLMSQYDSIMKQKNQSDQDVSGSPSKSVDSGNSNDYQADLIIERRVENGTDDSKEFNKTFQENGFKKT